jgi:replicative DNA helicase
MTDETKVKAIEQSIRKENLSVTKQIDILNVEIESLVNQLKVIQTKKEKYLDSLISNTFSEKERKTINSKIDDFSLEEKKIKTAIYKCQLSVDEQQDKIQKTDGFKKELIDLKINCKQWGFKELQTWFQKNIRQIITRNKDLTIEFKLIKLTV